MKKIIPTSGTGWTKIPGDTHTIIAYYNSGESRRMKMLDFLILRDKKNIIAIDCLSADESDQL